MVRNKDEIMSKVTRDGGLYIIVKDIGGYRKLHDHLQERNIFYHTFVVEK